MIYNELLQNISNGKRAVLYQPWHGFFYESVEHRLVLMRLMIEIRLKLGLILILGGVFSVHRYCLSQCFKRIVHKE